MCIGSLNYDSLSSSSLRRSWPLKRHLCLRLLNRKKAKLKEAKQRKLQRHEKLELKNLKLYMQNQSIMEENEKLRKKAMLLHKENQALFSHLQKMLSDPTKMKIIAGKSVTS